MRTLTLIALIDVGAYIAIGIYSNLQTAVAIFILIWMNNIGQSEEK